MINTFYNTYEIEDTIKDDTIKDGIIKDDKSDKNKKIVITFGTFDLYHKGHYNILKRAKSHGDKLIVGISSDWLNLTKKGVETVDNQEKRLRNIKKLDFVDDVFFEESLEDKPLYIKKYNADIIVMGDDWKNAFNKMGAKAIYLKRTPNISSTLLKKIYYNNNDFILKDKLKLHGTYKVPLTPINEIFPLKKYKFYDYHLWGPNKLDTMKNYYEKKCPMMTHAYAKWDKTQTIFKIENFDAGPFNYDNDTDLDYNNDGIYCTVNTKACVHTPNKYVGSNNDMRIRQCCRNKLNRIIVDVCKVLEDYQVPYFIYWGSLLGSIRHQGSIPWDTDNDIYIIDKDYNKLLIALYKSKIYSKYFLSKLNDNFLRVNFSKDNRVHLDIYIAEQFD